MKKKQRLTYTKKYEDAWMDNLNPIERQQAVSVDKFVNIRFGLVYFERSD